MRYLIGILGLGVLLVALYFMFGNGTSKTSLSKTTNISNTNISNPIPLETLIEKAGKGDASAQANLNAYYELIAIGTKPYSWKEQDPDYQKSLEWLRKAAESGDAIAQNNLGYVMYKTLYSDKEKAHGWFIKAAEQGNLTAQRNLCVNVGFEGSGLKGWDNTKATEWCRKAAEQGDALAQNYLGQAYNTGNGVTGDHQKAAEWYEKAAAQGNADAQYNLGALYYCGNNGIAQDYQQAFEWFRKAARQDNVVAQYSLGLMYRHGQGVPKDYQKAFEWFKKAEMQSHKLGQYDGSVRIFRIWLKNKELQADMRRCDMG